MTILIDTFEPESIQYQIEKAGIDTKRQPLEAGDYRFSNIGIERKTTNDFFKTLYDRRLYNQLYKLKQYYEYPKLAVIGSFSPDKKWIRTKKRIIPTKLSTEEKQKKEKLMINNFGIMDRSLGIQGIVFDNQSQFIQYIVALYINSERKEVRLKPVDKKGKTLFEIRSNIYSQYPGIGRKLANYLAERYPVKELVNLPIEEILKIENIGPKIGKRILET